MKRLFQIILLSLLLFSLPVFSQKSLKSGKVKTKNYFEEITFQFKKNKIIIPVQIEGKTYQFLLDTGAPNIISKEVFDAISAEIVNTIETSDANNKTQNLDFVKLKSLKLGAVEFSKQIALVYDLNGSPVFECLGIDGFIGSNLLKHSIIQINSEKKVLILTDDQNRLRLDRMYSKKIKLIGDQSSPYVWIQVKGDDSGREMVLIDTGMGNLYDLARVNYNVFKTKKIYNEIGTSDGASFISLFGEVPINRQTRVCLPKLIINEFEISNVITHTTKGSYSRIGAELLHYGMMTIDFKNKRFYFNPYSVLPNIENTFGFTQTIKENKLVIGYVWDKALKSKINYGDEILEINGQVINDVNFCDFVNKTSVLKTSNTINLKVKKEANEIVDVQIDKKQLHEIFGDFNIPVND